MYKVLIADDEMLIRQGLAGLFHGDERFEVSALAEDGEQALEMARACQPDLIFADINMPFMDGLDFIEKVKAEQPQINIVVVTGFDEFEFAQRALRLGMQDYILKPLSVSDFHMLLDRLVLKLEEQQLRRRHLEWAEQELRLHHDYLSDQFFGRWLLGELDQTEVEEQLRFLRITIPREYDLMLIALRENSETARSEGENATLVHLACQDLIREVLKSRCEYTMIRLNSDHLAVITERLKPASIWTEILQDLYAGLHDSFDMEVLTCLLHGEKQESIPELLEQGETELTAQKHYSRLVLDAIHIMEKELDNPELSLVSVSEKLHVSTQYLSRLFHSQTGITFITFLTRKRLRRAMTLLAEPSMRLYEIADQTGYTTQHYFSNVFKKTLGMTPGEYRRSLSIGGREDEWEA